MLFLCFFLCFFLWYELCFFLCFFLWYELCFFLCFFLCSGAPEKHKKKHKKAQKKHEKSTKKARKKHNFSGKNESQATWPRQPSDQRPGKCLIPFPFFQPPFQKKLSRVSPCQERECEKKCNYHMMFIKNLNNYCWRHAFVTLFTYNLQWLDRLIAVSRYLRYAAFNIVKNVMSHNIVSSYRCNTLHHHTISLPLLFDTQIFR